MTAMPTKSHLTSSAATEAQFQAAIGQLYDVINEMPLIGPTSSLQINSSGQITPTKGLVTVETENLSAADNLDFILATNLGERMIILNSTSAARVVTIRHNQSGTGKIITLDGQPIVLSDPSYRVILFYVQATTQWVELWRNFGVYAQAGDLASIRTKLGLGTASTKDTGTSSGQVPLNSNLGSAAYLNSGGGAGQVPTNGILGALAYLSQISAANMASSGVSPGTFNQFTVNAQGLITAASYVPAGVGTSSVGQSQLKSSIYVASWDSDTGVSHGTLPGTTGFNRYVRTTRFGGEFTFCPTIIWANSPLGGNYIERASLLTYEDQVGRDNSWYLVCQKYAIVTQIISLGARFITASAPYDLGDGEVYGFVYVLVNDDGSLAAAHVSDTPPWAYNGPTSIRPDYIDPQTGIKYKIEREKLSFEQIMAGKKPKEQLVEITTEMKNADMHLVPHPFSGKREDQKVLMFNPLDPDVAKLIQLAEQGENASKLILDGKFKIGNTMDNVKTPDGVLPVSFRW